MIQILADIILSKNFDEKIALAQQLPSHNIKSIPKGSPEFLQQFKQPGRPDDFIVVSPKDVPIRKMTDEKSRAHFLHAIANIELLAIELPCLCLLRFGSTDTGFIADQFNIIAEEAKHFDMLKNRLLELDCPFGSLPVHHGLWENAWSCDSAIEHQVLIPCYLEAKSLDVSPQFIDAFDNINDHKTADILRIILKEEIGHVQVGQRFMQKTAQELNTTPDELFKTITQNLLGDRIKRRGKIRADLRKQAGFTDGQIAYLNNGI